jgi:hypothetical protein
MRCRWITVVGAFVGGLAATACTDPVPGAPLQAHVVHYEGQAADEQPRFSLGPQPLTDVEDLSTLTGRYVRVVRGGQIDVNAANDGQLVEARFSGGGSADLRYDVRNGVVVPLDYSSLSMLSAYHQFQRILAALPTVAGLTADDVLARWGKLEVLFEPRLVSRTSEVDVTFTQKTNAFHVAGAHQFGLARRSSAEAVPLAADLRVLSHEFGHALFDDAFFEGQVERCDPNAGNADPFFPGRLRREYVVSGLNEGWSDFLSFAITGTTNPLSGAIEGVGDSRSLVRGAFTFTELLEPQPGCPRGSFYCVGTLFARSLYEVFVEQGGNPADPEARGAYARQVLGALTQTVPTVRQRGSLPAPGSRVSACHARSRAHADDGPLLAALLDAFVAGLPPHRQAPVCARFAANFGADGFPSAARRTCAR